MEADEVGAGIEVVRLRDENLANELVVLHDSAAHQAQPQPHHRAVLLQKNTLTDYQIIGLNNDIIVRLL